MNTKTIGRQALAALKMLAVCTLLFGIGYPLLIYGADHLFFDFRANGSMMPTAYGEMSLLAGQTYQDPGHLWGRMQQMETEVRKDGTILLRGVPANHSLGDADYLAQRDARIAQLKAANPDAKGEVPAELYTWSASGMDPDLSLDAALWQVPRIARATGLSEQEVRTVIENHARKALGGLMPAMVRVAEVNLDLDSILENGQS